MRWRVLQFLLLGILLATANAAENTAGKPRAVRDLHYGEVLFNFYQQDYLTAITHLMAAQQTERLQHHREEAELLLGGLQLSYGMLNQAEQLFRELLSEHPDTTLRNRIWYYIAKISYQRGLHHQAYTALKEIDTAGNAELQGETALLRANVRMALGKDSEAAAALLNVKAPDGWGEYLEINRGIALLRAGDIKKGRGVLDDLGTQRTQGDELRAMRDRANLGLGYELLRSGEHRSALEYLNRVRMRGPFMQAALLGAGWASAAEGKYQDALTPWLTLLSLASYDPPVQEAHLAVPYAFNQLGDPTRAIYYYDAAISYYDREQEELLEAREAVNSGAFPALLSQADSGESGGWLKANVTLENVPSGRYLVDVLASHAFQEQLKNYRDLGYLETLLRAWLENIDIYYDMVDARREAYAQRAPLTNEHLQSKQAQTLTTRWQQLQAQYELQSAADDPLALASTAEIQRWRKLQHIQERLGALPETPRHLDMLQRARWLQGVLYWQIQADYKERSWEIRKQLKEVGETVGAVASAERGLALALAKAPAGFSGYDLRIDSLRQRIATLLPALGQARAESTDHIRALALREINERELRLISYRTQARYALARNYDQLARTQEATP